VNRLVPFVAVGAVLAGACGVPAAQPLTAVRAAAIRDSVQATLDTFRRYSAAGQWDSLAALYANDADFRWLEQGVIQYRSAAQIREALRRASPTTRIETDYWDTKIVPLAPGVAAVATAFHTKLIESGNSPSREFSGVLDMTVVHRDGGWRILMGHSSSRPPSE
jgi:hypothetical protein